MIADLKYFCDAQRHLVCTPYTVENLHRMADDLGIKRSWFHKNASYPHYDIPKRRIDEISAKCTVVSAREILAIVKSSKDETMNEVHLNVHGKVLFGAIANLIRGKKVDLKMLGTPDQINILKKTVSALKKINSVLNEPTSTVKMLAAALKQKHVLTKEFEALFGMKWPANL